MKQTIDNKIVNEKYEQYIKKLEEVIPATIMINARDILSALCLNSAYYFLINKGFSFYDRETGELIGKFRTQLEASKSLGIDQSYISRLLRGLPNRKYIIKIEGYYDNPLEK